MPEGRGVRGRFRLDYINVDESKQRLKHVVGGCGGKLWLDDSKQR
jgi:hypothetical protein